MNTESLFFRPFVCPGCGDFSTRTVCNPCKDSLRRNHSALLEKNEGIRAIYPVFFSFETTHRILVHWKNSGGQGLKRLLFSASPALLEELRKLEIEHIVPIPQYHARNLKRGHAPALDVADWFARELGVKVEHEALILNPEPTDKQSLRGAWERRFLDDPFRVNLDLRGKLGGKVLIVDDFITSGSTLDKAANALMGMNPELRIHAASLGWRPRALPRNREPFRLVFPAQKSRTASLECQSDSQSVPVRMTIRTNH